MSDFDAWPGYAASVCRCLMAVSPPAGDAVFSDVNSPSSLPPAPPDAAGGGWYRSGGGYMYLGPEGGNHHYQREPPEGVALETIPDAPIAPPGELLRLLDDLITNTQAAGAGQAVSMFRSDGQPVTLQAAPEEQEGLQRLSLALAATRAACAPEYNLAFLRQASASAMQEWPSAMAAGPDAPQAMVNLLLPAASEAMTRRWQFTADARLVALYYTRTRLCELALERLQSGQAQPAAITRLAGMSLESASSGHDPERMLARMVTDAAGSGFLDLLLPICDEALTAADKGVQAAIAAEDIDTHAGHLYSAAHFGFAGMRLAEAYKAMTAPAARPPKASDAMLDGYARNCEEYVVRSQQALALDCINRGTGAALNRHIALLRSLLQAGQKDKAEAKIKEWIEQYYFYTRSSADRLMQDAAQS